MPRPHTKQTSILPPLPQSFIAKKARILESLSVPSDTYTDKSPKGSVDAPIVDLINDINAIDGLVTTSSCSGRVAVFVEGPTVPTNLGKEGADLDEGLRDEGSDEDVELETKAVTGSPAGKGGGKWLYVSHDPVAVPQSLPSGFFTRLCGLSEPPGALQPSLDPVRSRMSDTSGRPPRLIKLSFSPLILHIHCATLAHAKPLLAAAINAGFRESGVQSLKVLDDPDAGVTMGIRTAGLSFETVVGVVRESGNDRTGDSEGQDGESYEVVVDEEYLACMFDVIDGRFKWNERRKERLRLEIKRGFLAESDWEDGEVRRRRKREEGLRRQKERKETSRSNGVEVVMGADVEAEIEANGVGGLFEENNT